MLIIEDHELVREGLLLAVQNLEVGTETLGAPDANSALQRLAEHDDIALVVLDLVLPGTSGIAFLSVMRKCYPAIPVVILTAIDDVDTAASAIRKGAAGFVPKSSSTGQLLNALRQVLGGEMYLPSTMQEAIGRSKSRCRKSLADRYELTKAQMRVLDILAQGKTNQQIAELLGVTDGTVKIHVSDIFKAMKVSNRTQALLLAHRFQGKI